MKKDNPTTEEEYLIQKPKQIEAKFPPPFPNGYHLSHASVYTTSPIVCENCGSLTYVLHRIGHPDWPEKPDLHVCDVCITENIKMKQKQQEEYEKPDA